MLKGKSAVVGSPSGIGDAQPTRQFVTIEQAASLALYLCGDEAAQITGANLSIDGGWTAQ
jgi:3-hydroxybutyrate dehydrogenase